MRRMRKRKRRRRGKGKKGGERRWGDRKDRRGFHDNVYTVSLTMEY